jgi:hypothetical protein
MRIDPLRWKPMWGAGSFGREQAGKCQRLAENSTDPFTRERFLKLACDYLAQADAEDRDPADQI